MKTIEDRLRDALAERAKYSPIDPGAWERTRARSLAARKARFGWRWHRPGLFLIPAAAAAAVVVIILGVTVAVNGITGRSAGAPGGSPGSASAAPVPSTSSPSALGYLQTTPVSAILALPVTSPGSDQTAVAYSWIGYTSPYAWTNERQGLKSCSEVASPQGLGGGNCVSLPRLDADQPASVTSSNGENGLLVLQGLAVSRVTSVTAVLPDGRQVPGVVKTGRGFPDKAKAWAVVAPTSGKTFSPVSGERLVFRDASGAEVATRGTTAAVPVPVAEPGSGGIVAFTPCCGSVYAYLIDGYVGFFWGKPGWMAPQLAAGPPAAAGLISSFSAVWEAFGYSHENVTRVVLHLGGGQRVSTSTFAAWPGSGLRLWAVRLRGQPEFHRNGKPAGTVTGYDSAGRAVAQVGLGFGG